MAPSHDITVTLGDRSYPVRVGADCLARDLGAFARAALPGCDRVLVVTDSNVAPLYAAGALESLRAAGLVADLADDLTAGLDVGLPTDVLELPAGEANKTVGTVGLIWDRLIAAGATRQSALVALGGGVVGDMTGFAAATYMRGVRFVQAPTTLLAMVDSSVGGKTGVNHPLAKNTIGAFWQPRGVLADVAALATLPAGEFRSGFAEVIKHGAIRDLAYFEWLERDLDAILALDPAALERVVRGSVEVKAAVVAADEREAGVRAILNFGHTLGHAVEALAGYGTVRHGEAVAMGMVGAAGIARRMGLCSAADAERLTRLIERAGLPTRFVAQPPSAVKPSDVAQSPTAVNPLSVAQSPSAVNSSEPGRGWGAKFTAEGGCATTMDLALTVPDILAKLKSDKKVRNGRVRFVLPVRLGEVVVRDDVPPAVVAETILEMGAKSS